MRPRPTVDLSSARRSNSAFVLMTTLCLGLVAAGSAASLPVIAARLAMRVESVNAARVTAGTELSCRVLCDVDMPSTGTASSDADYVAELSRILPAR